MFILTLGDEVLVALKSLNNVTLVAYFVEYAFEGLMYSLWFETYSRI